MIVALIVVLLLIIQPGANKPFKNLSTSEISSVSVELRPPNNSFNLSADDIDELIEILNSVVLYNEDNSYTEYNGQAVIYTIIKTDGTVLTINAYNPFLVINGIGYKTKYKPCEELDALGNRIGGTRF